MLADLGADVIKVEPPAGDLTRFASPRVNGLATYFVQQNVGKRNVSIDLGDAARRRAGRSTLAEHCDVLVENYRAGVMERLGLGADGADGPQPPARLRLDHRLRRHRAVGRTGGPTPRSSAPRPGSPRRRATPAAATTPTTR